MNNKVFHIRLFILIAFSTALSFGSLYAQELDKLKEKKQAYIDKLASVKDTIKSKRLTINGNLFGNAAYNVINAAENQFDYNVGANILATYKGLKIPFSYRFSNGRSITQFQGPSIRTPSFNVIGLSPSHKGITLHLGDRIMDFTDRTYNNMRFKGIGIETKDEGVYIKAMRGSLRALSPADQVFRNNVEFRYKRRAWGGQLGYKKEKLHIQTTVFTANDEFDRMLDPTTVEVNPKENTSLAYLVSLSPVENITITAEQSISALTSNAFEERINILTHQTTKNMLGLFEKKTSSAYFNASRAELAYLLENQKFSIEYENVDKGYISLGSFNYDNNFIDYRLNGNGQINEKIVYSTSVGLRDIKTQEFQNEQDLKFVFNATTNYQHSEQLNLYVNFSNFKTSQNTYYQTQNSSQVDSLILSQVNNAIAFGGSYRFSSEKASNLTFIYSYQATNTIQDDQVNRTSINNHLVNLGYNKTSDKHSFSAMCGYTQNIAEAFETKSVIASLSHGFDINEQVTIQHVVNANFITFSTNQTTQIQLRQSCDWLINDISDLILETSYDLNNSIGHFQLANFQINLGTKLTLRPKHIIK